MLHAGFQERTLHTEELSLNLAHGPNAGPPLLCLHGITRRWQDFMPLFPALSCRWSVHGLDFRGHGRSGRAAGRYRVRDYVHDGMAALRSFAEPVVLYGHSLGALVAAALAANAPEQVKAIILEDPPALEYLMQIERTPYHAQFLGMRRLAGAGRTVAEVARELADLRLPAGRAGDTIRLGSLRDAASLRFSARALLDLDPEVFAPVLDRTWLDGYDGAAQWGKIACPVLLLQADPKAGGMLPPHEAEILAEQIPDCTRVELPGVGHLIHWFALERAQGLILAFLESL